MDKIGINTIETSLGGQLNIKNDPPIPNKIISPWIDPSLNEYFNKNEDLNKSYELYDLLYDRFGGKKDYYKMSRIEKEYLKNLSIKRYDIYFKTSYS